MISCFSWRYCKGFKTASTHSCQAKQVLLLKGKSKHLTTLLKFSLHKLLVFSFHAMKVHTNYAKKLLVCIKSKKALSRINCNLGMFLQTRGIGISLLYKAVQRKRGIPSLCPCIQSSLQSVRYQGGQSFMVSEVIIFIYLQ